MNMTATTTTMKIEDLESHVDALPIQKKSVLIIDAGMLWGFSQVCSSIALLTQFPRMLSNQTTYTLCFE